MYLEHSQTDTVTETIGKHTHTSNPREPLKDTVSEACDTVWVPSMGTSVGAVEPGPEDTGPRVSQLCGADTAACGLEHKGAEQRLCPTSWRSL